LHARAESLNVSNDVARSEVRAKLVIDQPLAFRHLDGKNHADVIMCAAHLEDESLFEFADAIHIRLPVTCRALRVE